MSISLKELLAQKAMLDAKIADVQRSERAEAIEKIKASMLEYGLTMQDLTAKTSSAMPKGSMGNRGSKGKVAAKYRDVKTGDSWSGRGLQPIWLRSAIAAGRNLSDFAI